MSMFLYRTARKSFRPPGAVAVGNPPKADIGQRGPGPLLPGHPGEANYWVKNYAINTTERRFFKNTCAQTVDVFIKNGHPDL